MAKLKLDDAKPLPATKRPGAEEEEDLLDLLGG